MQCDADETLRDAICSPFRLEPLKGSGRRGRGLPCVALSLPPSHLAPKPPCGDQAAGTRLEQGPHTQLRAPAESAAAAAAAAGRASSAVAAEAAAAPPSMRRTEREEIEKVENEKRQKKQNARVYEKLLYDIEGWRKEDKWDFEKEYEFAYKGNAKGNYIVLYYVILCYIVL